MKRVGIYINAFDPVNQFDLDFAQSAIEQVHLDRIYFLAEPRPRYNQGVKAYEHRNHMVILAVKADSKLGTIVVKPQLASPLETAKIINNRFLNQSPTIVLPEDRLSKLDSWTWLKLNNQPLNLAIGLDKLKPKDVESQIKTINVILASSLSYSVFQAPNPSKHSASIRHQLRLGQRPEQLPSPVYDYIIQKELYSSRSSA